MKLVGVDVDHCDDGGGISVQGDTTINNTGLKGLGTVAVVLLALATGIGATYLLTHLCPKAVAAPLHPTDPTSWKLGLRVSNEP